MRRGRASAWLSVLALAVGACVLDGLVGAAASSADGGLPRTAVIAPPPEHRADPTLRTHVVRAGPFSVGPYGVVKRADRVPAPPEAGSIVGMDVRLVDEQGAVVPQHILMLHHFVMVNGGVDGRRRDGVCPNRPVRERFYGTSEELRALTLPRGYGYPTDPRDRWNMIWMVMNHRAAPRQVYVEYRVTVDPQPLTPVTPYWLSVLPCGQDQQYSVPGGGAALHRRAKRFDLPAGGRIVAVGGHMHGGGIGLTLSQPRCAGRELFTSRPTYAPAGDPLYGVKPLLHEPDPKNMSWWQSARGWPVIRGERLSLAAFYDGTRPHMRVMGIAHVYVATDPAAPADCAAPPPDDSELLGAEFSDGRPLPPPVRLTIARLGSDRRARVIQRPAGAISRAERSADVSVQHYEFSPANLSIAAGGNVRWAFKDANQHDVTVARAPLGFAAPYSVRGDSFQQRLDVPGDYRLYCSLHPTLMSQYVRVRSR